MNCEAEIHGEKFSLLFSLNIDKIKLRVYLGEPDCITRTEWSKLRDAIKNRQRYVISFHHGSGHGMISTSKGQIKFSSMVSGYGSDMETSFSLPNKYAEEMIKTIDNIVNNPLLVSRWQGPPSLSGF